MKKRNCILGPASNTVIGIGNYKLITTVKWTLSITQTGDHKLYFKARGWRYQEHMKSQAKFTTRKTEGVDPRRTLEWSYFCQDKSSKIWLLVEKTRTAASAGNGPMDDGNEVLIWKANDREHLFAITLNGPQPHLLPWLPPTDTRLRPDQEQWKMGVMTKLVMRNSELKKAKSKNA